MVSRTLPGPRIAIIGDSTSKYLVADAESLYANRIATTFRSWGYAPALWNWAVSGQTSVYFAETNLAERIIAPFTVCRPQLLILAVGTNDLQTYNGGNAAYTPERLRANILTIIDQAVAVSAGVHVIICNLIHKMGDAAYDAEVAAWNVAVTVVAAARNGQVADIYNAYSYADRNTHTADWIHPNEVGHLAIHDVIQAIIVAQGWGTEKYARIT